MSQFDGTSFDQAQPSLYPQNFPTAIIPNNWLPLLAQVPYGNTTKPKQPFANRAPLPFPLRQQKSCFSGGMNQAQNCVGRWEDINYGGRPVLSYVVNSTLPNISFITYQTLSGALAAPVVTTAPTVLFTFNIPQNMVAALAGITTGISDPAFQDNFIWSLIYNSQDVLHGQANADNTGLVTPNKQFVPFGTKSEDWQKFLAGTTLTFTVSAVAALISGATVSASILLALFPKE